MTSDLPILSLDRAGWRQWLSDNYSSSRGCWLKVDRGGSASADIDYLDSVEEALCFGWIDSTVKRIDEAHLQRFTPRRDLNKWTELNLARCHRLEKLGLMTDAGRAVIPDRQFSIDDRILDRLKADDRAWDFFQGLPELYVRVRVGNIQTKRGTPLYDSRLERFVDDCRRGRVVGNWNDGGRLTEP